MESSLQPISGTLNYKHESHLSGESDATVEITDDKLVIEFRLVEGGKGLEDVVVATVSTTPILFDRSRLGFAK